MKTVFKSDNEKMQAFIEMGRLIAFLESDVSKKDKVAEIKAARANGLVDDDEAVMLACEFC